MNSSEFMSEEENPKFVQKVQKFNAEKVDKVFSKNFFFLILVFSVVLVSKFASRFR